MHVLSVTLSGFRNYTGAKAEFSPGVNVISGRNAQGKTNLLEALYYMSTGRSFRASSDRELICHTSDNAEITAEVFSSDRASVITARLFVNKRRELFAAGTKLKRASDLAGRINSVVFTPGDLGIVRDGAVVRRKLMDSALCQLRPRYLTALASFNRLYDHKLRVLRDYRDKPSLLETLDDFNNQLAECGATLIYYRAAFASLLAKKAEQIHREFTNASESLSIVYKTVKTVDTTSRDISKITASLLEHQREYRQTELDSAQCLSGAHKDELDISIGGEPARKFASQGQARTAAISIKLAERDIFYDDRGEYPVLLLDDVLSELDETRQSFVLNRITDGQVFITCCEDDKIAGRTGGHVLRVDGGNIVRG